MSRIRLAAVTAASAACLVSLSVASGAAAGTASAAIPASHTFIPAPGTGHLHPDTAGGTNADEQSENWAGYIASGSKGAFSSSTATWTVPTLSTTKNGYSSTWVGIDGATSNDEYLIQTGTEADVVNKKASYDAWWEVITPTDEAPETLFSNLTVKPGDSITASVAKGSSGKWTMKLVDNTSGATASHSSSFSGPGESEEWIQEDTDVNNVISPAPDWKKVTFSGITSNGKAANLNSASSVDIYDSNGTQETSTSAPTSAGNGFSVTWLASGTGTPVD